MNGGGERRKKANEQNEQKDGRDSRAGKKRSAMPEPRYHGRDITISAGSGKAGC